MWLEIISDAESELVNSAEWYESRILGLGGRYLIAVNEAFEKIWNSPLAWTEIHNDIRRVVVNRFPYDVLYLLRNDRVLIVAITHHR